jgi:hypothetical protein
VLFIIFQYLQEKITGRRIIIETEEIHGLKVVPQLEMN